MALYLLVVMTLRALGFRVDSRSGEVLRDCFGRPISLDPELAETIASERCETDPSFPEVPSRLLSSHSWKQVTADKRFFDDDVLRLEARALVKAAERSSHSQPIHDCKVLLLSDNVSIVLCFNHGRSRDFRLLTPIGRFASVPQLAAICAAQWEPCGTRFWQRCDGGWTVDSTTREAGRAPELCKL